MRNREREAGREKSRSQVYPFTHVHVCVCAKCILLHRATPFDQTMFNSSNCSALKLILSAIIKSKLSPMFNVYGFSIRLILMFL